MFKISGVIKYKIMAIMLYVAGAIALFGLFTDNPIVYTGISAPLIFLGVLFHWIYKDMVKNGIISTGSSIDAQYRVLYVGGMFFSLGSMFTFLGFIAVPIDTKFQVLFPSIIILIIGIVLLIIEFKAIRRKRGTTDEAQRNEIDEKKQSAGALVGLIVGEFVFFLAFLFGLLAIYGKAYVPGVIISLFGSGFFILFLILYKRRKGKPQNLDRFLNNR